MLGPAALELGQARLQAVVDQAQLAPVGFVPVALPQVVGRLGHPRLVVGDGGRQGGVGAGPPDGLTVLDREGQNQVAVAAQHHLLLGSERIAEGLGPGVGVAVLVAADPGAEAEEGAYRGRWSSEHLHPAPVELGVDGGDGIHQQVHVEPDVARLVEDARAHRAQLLGLPEQLDVPAHRGDQSRMPR